VWGVGHSATLLINPQMLAQAGNLTALRFRMSGFVYPRYREQRASIRIDGTEVKQLHFRYPDATKLTVDVPVNDERLKSGRAITIEFVMPESVSPDFVGLNGDTRLIGIGLESLELVAGEH
jgi:hypothetical protein